MEDYANKWLKILSINMKNDNLHFEFADVFKLPSILQEYEIKHRIELMSDNTPPIKWQYRMSTSELAKVH